MSPARPALEGVGNGDGGLSLLSHTGVSVLLSSALDVFDGSSGKAHIFPRKEDALNGLNTPRNIPAPCYEVCS